MLSKRFAGWIFVALALLAVPFLPLTAEEGKAPEKDPTKEKPQEISEKGQNVELLSTAFTLADHGSKTKSSLELLTAAKIIGTMPVNPDKESPESGLALQKEAQRLLTEAKKLNEGENSEAVAALIKDVQTEIRETKRAGRLGGPFIRERSLNGRDRTTFTHEFTPGWATIRVRNLSQGADLNLWVYQFNTGNFVTSDSRANEDDAYVRFYVPSTQKYRVVMGNRGFKAAQYVYITN